MSPARTDELGPCPRCKKIEGEVYERKGARFPFYACCGACNWSTEPVTLRAVAVTRWKRGEGA